MKIVMRSNNWDIPQWMTGVAKQESQKEENHEIQNVDSQTYNNYVNHVSEKTQLNSPTLYLPNESRCMTSVNENKKQSLRPVSPMNHGMSSVSISQQRNYISNCSRSNYDFRKTEDDKYNSYSLLNNSGDIDFNISADTTQFKQTTEECSTSIVQHPEIRKVTSKGETVTKISEKTIVKHIREEVQFNNPLPRNQPNTDSRKQQPISQEALQILLEKGATNSNNSHFMSSHSTALNRSKPKKKSLQQQITEENEVINNKCPPESAKTGNASYSFKEFARKTYKQSMGPASSVDHSLYSSIENDDVKVNSSFPNIETTPSHSQLQMIQPTLISQVLPQQSHPVSQHLNSTSLVSVDSVPTTSKSSTSLTTNQINSHRTCLSKNLSTPQTISATTETSNRLLCTENRLLRGGEQSDQDLLKVVIEQNKDESTVVYDSLVLLQNYVRQQKYTPETIQRMLQEEELNSQNEKKRYLNLYLLKSLQLAVETPILLSQNQSLVDPLEGSIQWDSVFKKLKSFIDKCVVDVLALKKLQQTSGMENNIATNYDQSSNDNLSLMSSASQGYVNAPTHFLPIHQKDFKMDAFQCKTRRENTGSGSIQFHHSLQKCVDIGSFHYNQSTNQSWNIDFGGDKNSGRSIPQNSADSTGHITNPQHGLTHSNNLTEEHGFKSNRCRQQNQLTAGNESEIKVIQQKVWHEGQQQQHLLQHNPQQQQQQQQKQLQQKQQKEQQKQQQPNFQQQRLAQKQHQSPQLSQQFSQQHQVEHGEQHHQPQNMQHQHHQHQNLHQQQQQAEPRTQQLQMHQQKHLEYQQPQQLHQHSIQTVHDPKEQRQQLSKQQKNLKQQQDQKRQHQQQHQQESQEQQHSSHQHQQQVQQPLQPQQPQHRQHQLHHQSRRQQQQQQRKQQHPQHELKQQQQQQQQQKQKQPQQQQQQHQQPVQHQQHLKSNISNTHHDSIVNKQYTGQFGHCLIQQQYNSQLKQCVENKNTPKVSRNRNQKQSNPCPSSLQVNPASDSSAFQTVLPKGSSMYSGKLDQGESGDSPLPLKGLTIAQNEGDVRRRLMSNLEKSAGVASHPKMQLSSDLEILNKPEKPGIIANTIVSCDKSNDENIGNDTGNDNYCVIRNNPNANTNNSNPPQTSIALLPDHQNSEPCSDNNRIYSHTSTVLPTPLLLPSHCNQTSILPTKVKQVSNSKSLVKEPKLCTTKPSKRGQRKSSKKLCSFSGPSPPIPTVSEAYSSFMQGTLQKLAANNSKPDTPNVTRSSNESPPRAIPHHSVPYLMVAPNNGFLAPNSTDMTANNAVILPTNGVIPNQKSNSNLRSLPKSPSKSYGGVAVYPTMPEKVISDANIHSNSPQAKTILPAACSSVMSNVMPHDVKSQSHTCRGSQEIDEVQNNFSNMPLWSDKLQKRNNDSSSNVALFSKTPVPALPADHGNRTLRNCGSVEVNCMNAEVKPALFNSTEIPFTKVSLAASLVPYGDTSGESSQDESRPENDPEFFNKTVNEYVVSKMKEGHDKRKGEKEGMSHILKEHRKESGFVDHILNIKTTSVDVTVTPLPTSKISDSLRTNASPGNSGYSFVNKCTRVNAGPKEKPDSIPANIPRNKGVPKSPNDLHSYTTDNRTSPILNDMSTVQCPTSGIVTYVTSPNGVMTSSSPGNARKMAFGDKCISDKFGYVMRLIELGESDEDSDDTFPPGFVSKVIQVTDDETDMSSSYGCVSKLIECKEDNIFMGCQQEKDIQGLEEELSTSQPQTIPTKISSIASLCQSKKFGYMNGPLPTRMLTSTIPTATIVNTNNVRSPSSISVRPGSQYPYIPFSVIAPSMPPLSRAPTPLQETPSLPTIHIMSPLADDVKKSDVISPMRVSAVDTVETLISYATSCDNSAVQTAAPTSLKHFSEGTRRSSRASATKTQLKIMGCQEFEEFVEDDEEDPETDDSESDDDYNPYSRTGPSLSPSPKGDDDNKPYNGTTTSLAPSSEADGNYKPCSGTATHLPLLAEEDVDYIPCSGTNTPVLSPLPKVDSDAKQLCGSAKPCSGTTTPVLSPLPKVDSDAIPLCGSAKPCSGTTTPGLSPLPKVDRDAKPFSGTVPSLSPLPKVSVNLSSPVQYTSLISLPTETALPIVTSTLSETAPVTTETMQSLKSTVTNASDETLLQDMNLPFLDSSSPTTPDLIPTSNQNNGSMSAPVSPFPCITTSTLIQQTVRPSSPEDFQVEKISVSCSSTEHSSAVPAANISKQEESISLSVPSSVPIQGSQNILLPASLSSKNVLKSQPQTVHDIVSRFKVECGDKYAGNQLIVREDGRACIKLLKYLNPPTPATHIKSEYRSIKCERRDSKCVEQYKTSPLKVVLSDCNKSLNSSSSKKRFVGSQHMEQSSSNSKKSKFEKEINNVKRKLKLECPTNAAVSKKKSKGQKKIFKLQTKPCGEFAELPKCLDCKSDDVGEAYCRFNMFRKLDVTDPRRTLVTGFSDPNSASEKDLPHWTYQNKVNLNLDLSEHILKDISVQFQQLVLQELDAKGWTGSEDPVWKQAVLRVREMCDICSTTVFNMHWTCPLCGLSVCLDCYRSSLDYDKGEKNVPYSWPNCDAGRHHTEQLIVTQIIPKNILVDLLRDLLYVAKKVNLKFRRLDMLEYDGSIGIDQNINRSFPELADSKLISDEDLFDDPPYENHESNNYVLPPDCRKFCNGRMVHIENPNFTDGSEIMELFTREFRNGVPVIVSHVRDRLKKDLWTPQSLSKEFGDELYDIVNCYDGSTIPDFRIGDFWDGFENVSVRPIFNNEPVTLLKLKDWPPKENFSKKLPNRFADVMQALPAPSYTHRNGDLNLAARLPKFFAVPDLGPKMYNAYGSASYPRAGTTNLHLDISDATNVIAYVGIPHDEVYGKKETEDTFAVVDRACCEVTQSRIREPGVKPGALWHIFPAHSARKIRRFLRRVADERGMVLSERSDPIHDQSFYLDLDLLKKLKAEEGVEGYAICQCEGDAVFIPAGAPHQVLNLHSCIKVAEDFVAPDHIAHCFQLTQEFRYLSDHHTNHEDKLQIKNILFHAVKDCLGVLKKYHKL